MNGEKLLPKCFLFTDQHQVESFVIIFFFKTTATHKQTEKGATSCCNYRFLQMEDERRVYFSSHFSFSPLFLLLNIFSFSCFISCHFDGEKPNPVQELLYRLV